MHRNCLYRAVAITSRNYVSFISVWQKVAKVQGEEGTADACSNYYYKPDPKLEAQHLEKLFSSSIKIHMFRRRLSSTEMYFGCFLLSTFITLIYLYCIAAQRKAYIVVNLRESFTECRLVDA